MSADATLNIIEDAKAKAEARVKDLEPMVKEHRELSDFLAKLAAPVQVPQPDAEPDEPAAPKPQTRAQIDAAINGGKDKGAKKRRSRKGGTTSDKALAIIQENPGIGASEVADRMGIKPNYLYRVLGDLHKEKRVTKDGSKYSVA